MRLARSMAAALVGRVVATNAAGSLGDTGAIDLLGRQEDGYNPQLGSCGSGDTCAEACGRGFEECHVIEGVMMFCYEPGAGETCCKDGSGRGSCLAANCQ